MSVVVRMEMPEGCWDCPCVNGEYGYCQADKEERQIEDPNERPSWCPIVCALPEGHGRLVDADALMELMLERKQPLLGADNSKERYRYMQWLADFNAIRDVKTIVHAERSEE